MTSPPNHGILVQDTLSIDTTPHEEECMALVKKATKKRAKVKKAAAKKAHPKGKPVRWRTRSTGPKAKKSFAA